jgi:hypothetical protein
MNEFDGMIEYLDQYSENITLFIKEGVTNNLKYRIYNTHLKMMIYSHIQSKIIDNGSMLDCAIDFDHSLVNVQFKDYIAEHFKKLLSKKAAKNSKGFRLTAKGQLVKMEIVKDNDIIDTLEFIIEGNESIINFYPECLFSIHFPKNDVLKFIININSKINIFINRDSILMTHEECGMRLCSLVKI